MDKGKNEEQKFLRDIERIVNGEEFTPAEDSSEDAKSTIEFAKILTELRAEPSPEFREGLKSKLLRKLTAQEMAAREHVGAGWLGGFWNKLIPQSPVWRTAVVTVAILVVAVGVVWRTGIFGMGDAETTGENGRDFEETAADDSPAGWEQEGLLSAGEEEEEQDGTSLSIPEPSTDKSTGAFSEEVEIEVGISSSDIVTTLIGTRLSVQYGAEITWILTIKNTSTERVTVGPFPPEITVVESMGLSPVLTLPAVDTSFELEPSKTLIRVISWDQLDNDSTQVPVGAYQFNIGSITITRWPDDSAHVILLPSIEVVISEP
jgi:hypothetical protein